MFEARNEGQDELEGQFFVLVCIFQGLKYHSESFQAFWSLSRTWNLHRNFAFRAESRIRPRRGPTFRAGFHRGYRVEFHVLARFTLRRVRSTVSRPFHSFLLENERFAASQSWQLVRRTSANLARGATFQTRFLRVGWLESMSISRNRLSRVLTSASKHFQSPWKIIQLITGPQSWHFTRRIYRFISLDWRSTRLPSRTRESLNWLN